MEAAPVGIAPASAGRQSGEAEARRTEWASNLQRACVGGRVDLHLHSRASDGRDSPTELVHKAKAQGMEMIAVTDHDNLSGIAEAISAGRAIGLEVVPGVELSTDLAGDPAGAQFGTDYLSLHLLGYGIDLEHPGLRAAMTQMLMWRVDRNRRLLRHLAERGYPLTEEELAAEAGTDTYIGKPNIARALIRKGLLADEKQAFAADGPLNDSAARAIRRRKLPAKEVFRLIHDAGGVAVLAHPAMIRALGYQSQEPEPFFGKLRRLLEVLKGYGLNGLECRYSGHRPELAERLAALAEEMGFIQTCGSDYHGDDSVAWLKIGATALPEGETPPKKAYGD